MGRRLERPAQPVGLVSAQPTRGVSCDRATRFRGESKAARLELERQTVRAAVGASAPRMARTSALEEQERTAEELSPWPARNSGSTSSGIPSPSAPWTTNGCAGREPTSTSGRIGGSRWWRPAHDSAVAQPLPPTVGVCPGRERRPRAGPARTWGTYTSGSPWAGKGRYAAGSGPASRRRPRHSDRRARAHRRRLPGAIYRGHDEVKRFAAPPPSCSPPRELLTPADVRAARARASPGGAGGTSRSGATLTRGARGKGARRSAPSSPRRSARGP